MSTGAEWGTILCEYLALRGVSPYKMTPNFEHEGSHIIIAMPEQKVGIATDGDVYANLQRDGWTIEYIPLGTLKQFASTADRLTALATTYTVRASAEQMVKAGSQEETRLFEAILRAGLPKPTRNLRVLRADGTNRELTVPDFAWPEHKVAFFVDGLWWHVGKDSAMQRKAGEGDEEVIKEAERQQLSRATKDAKSRSQLTLMGWLVLSCTDENLSSDEGVLEQVANIKRALASRAREAAQQTSPTVPAQPLSLEEMFSAG